MKQLANCLSLVLLGSAAIAAGCSTSASNSSDGGPKGTGGTGSTSNLQALLPDATGYVDVGATGTTGIKGAWYAYGDGIGSDGTTLTGDCEAKGGHAATDCSAIASPSFGNFPNTMGKMCTMGTVAKIINITGGTTLDYNNIWGAGIGLDLNNGGGDAGAMKLPYNAAMNGVIGMAFDIDVVPAANMRVEFPTKTATNAAFWDGLKMISPVQVGHNEILWSKVTGPFYDNLAPAFDPTTIYSVQFHVLTSGTSSGTYNFCISNLSAILAN
jgi:hypothetical protein